jgi:Protein kinase domain
MTAGVTGFPLGIQPRIFVGFFSRSVRSMLDAFALRDHGMRGRFRLLSLILCSSSGLYGAQIDACTELKESGEDPLILGEKDCAAAHAGREESQNPRRQRQDEEERRLPGEESIPLLPGPRKENSIASYQRDKSVAHQHGTTRHKDLLADQHHLHIQFLWNTFRQIPKLLSGGEAFRRLLLPGGTSHRQENRRHDAEFDADLLFRKRAISRPSTSASGVQLRGDGTIVSHEDLDASDPHVGMVLTVATSARDEISYELMEILHLELGGRAVHVNDYAYTPVLSDRTTDPLLLGHESREGDDDVVEEDEETERSLGRDQERLSDEGTAHDLEESSHPAHAWWQWWIPKQKYKDTDRDGDDPFRSYRMNRGAFAGGSHGQVWRGRRRCDEARRTRERATQGSAMDDIQCNKPLILKRLKVDTGYRILEAGLREVHFGRWLAQQVEERASLFTRYVDHFFREDRDGGQALDLWIVFADAGPSLRSYLYTGIIVGDLVLYQQSALWTQMRLSVASTSSLDKGVETTRSLSGLAAHESQSREGRQPPKSTHRSSSLTFIGREVMRSVLKQILEAAAFLHTNGIVHRDIKPSNVMCASNITLESILSEENSPPWSGRAGAFPVHCVLGDFSSAWSLLIDRNLYTQGPSRFEQSDEYAPPEAIFGNVYNRSELSPAFDSWSIGILALEMVRHLPYWRCLESDPF